MDIVLESIEFLLDHAARFAQDGPSSQKAAELLARFKSETAPIMRIGSIAVGEQRDQIAEKLSDNAARTRVERSSTTGQTDPPAPPSAPDQGSSDEPSSDAEARSPAAESAGQSGV